MAGLKATGGVNQATVTWQPPVWGGTTPVTKYKVTAYNGSTAVKTYDNLPPATTSQLVSGLPSKASLKFSVRAYNAGGYSTASKTLVGTAMSYPSLSPTTISAGQSTKLSGKLTRVDSGAAVKGVRVYLQGRKKGSTAAFTDVTSMTTSSTGSYAFVRKPSSSWEFRVQYRSGGPTLMGSTSSTRVVTVR